MFGIKTTNEHKDYWKNRKIDWEKHYMATWNHPHRELIVQALRTFNWFSLWEVGCACGANLVKITKELKGRQLGGSDVNADAIELARKTFNGGMFQVESSEDLLMSDNSVDVVLSDAHLLYIAPKQIDKVIHEMTRISRGHIVLCEFNINSLWKRLLFRFKTQYNAYNYRELLEKHGCYDIQLVKIPKGYWDDTLWSTYGYIIIAKVVK